jgi:hypothetical protein
VLALSGAVCSGRDDHGRDHGGDPAGEFGRFMAARLEVLGGWVGSNSPTFEFRSDQAPKMFTRYARHFENTWNLAEDWTR